MTWPVDLSFEVSGWPVGRAAVGVTGPEATVGLGGDVGWVTRIASVSKTMVAFAALIAHEEGTIEIGEPAGPDGSTVRHLLAHASGLGLDRPEVVAPPGRRRIYSNVGIEMVADLIEQRAAMPFVEYLTEAVFDPLGMTRTRLAGSPAHGVSSAVDDLLRFGRELMAPTLVSARTLAEATRPAFPGLAGVLPGVGRYEPNSWGLGFEIRGSKQPHWTGTRNSSRTYGHFGGSGSFLWVDPEPNLACVSLSDREFDGWGLRVWPGFSDSVLKRLAAPQR